MRCGSPGPRGSCRCAIGEVKRFEAHIDELSHLRELEIIAIGLRKLPDAFAKLGHLERIDVSDNV